MVTLHSHATRLGVLDIGSNTVHMLIVDAAPGARPEPEASTKSTIRLMQYLKDDGSIKKAGIEALLSAVEKAMKLAEEYEITSGAQLPDDDAIESALREHYAIFDPNGHAERLLELRKAALIVMREVSDCKPLLIRGVLNGCADKYSDIYIAVECDDAKSLEIVLIDREIEIEVFPNERPGKNEPVEEIVFEAPVIRGGYFDRQHLTVWVRLKVFEDHAKIKNLIKKNPDPWQIEEETAKTANIEQLERLISLTEPE